MQHCVPRRLSHTVVRGWPPRRGPTVESTGEPVFTFILIGLATGAVYGMSGVGLVLTYRTSNVFNFAYGAIGTLAAYAFYSVHVNSGIAWPVAAAIAVITHDAGARDVDATGEPRRKRVEHRRDVLDAVGHAERHIRSRAGRGPAVIACEQLPAGLSAPPARNRRRYFGRG